MTNENRWFQVRIWQAELQAKLAAYEKQFGMTTDEFLEKWKAGEMPDTFETNDWSIIAKYREDEKPVPPDNY